MCTWVAFGLCVSDMGATLMQVGLGTDVAGGYSPSMLSAMRSAVVAAKATGMLRTDRARLAVRRRPSPSSDQPLASRHLPEPAGASAAAAASATDRGAASGAAGATGRGRTAQGERECRSEAAAATEGTVVQTAAEAAGSISVDGHGTGEELDYMGAFWLATMGGAQALGLEVILHFIPMCHPLTCSLPSSWTLPLRILPCSIFMRRLCKVLAVAEDSPVLHLCLMFMPQIWVTFVGAGQDWQLCSGKGL